MGLFRGGFLASTTQACHVLGDAQYLAYIPSCREVSKNNDTLQEA